jgi:lipopolysaccharide/colanic/teichoic acid biosynthesis glycosyltransferase
MTTYSHNLSLLRTSNDDTIVVHSSQSDPVRRTLDIAGAIVGLMTLGPLMLACAVWIKLADGGPVLYHQWRVGRGGSLFRIHKFRTMRQDAERIAGARFASQSDPRVLPGCMWMRRSHADELPQLWNVLTGDMSLVGPRPERPELHHRLLSSLPRMNLRLAVRPGITGLAQVRNGYTDDVTGARKKLAYDLLYLRHRSVLSDVRLILETLPKVWDHAAR